METKDALTALGALAQPTRLSIYRALAAANGAEISAGALAKQLRVAPATLSFHLRELSHARLILGRPEARFVFYSANTSAMKGLIDYLVGAHFAPIPSRGVKPRAPAKSSSRKTTAGGREPGRRR